MVDAAGTTKYTYTALGELLTEDGPLSSDTVTYGYHASVPRLRTSLSLQQPSGSWSQTYGYDAGKRLSTVGGTAGTHTYNWGQDLSGSFEGAGGIGGLLARSDQCSSGTWGRHVSAHADGNGNVTALSDSTQAVVGSYVYNPYGQVLAQSGALASANKIRFSTKLWFDSINLYYYGYRFCDPGLQRWLNRDPVGERGGINLYRYVKNDPIRRIDALGLEDSELLRPDSPPPITRPRPGATDQWPFKYYQPGSARRGYGDWERGNDLKDCEMLAKERYGWREARGLRKKVPGACLPGGLPVVGVYIELLLVWWLGEYDRRAAESKLVLELDIWACYCTWDPNGAQSRFPLIDL